MNEKLPKIVCKKPFQINVEAGKKYSWCSCGLSNNQPFCDGAHKAFKNSDGTSIMKSIPYIATESGVVNFCGCKHTKNGSLCDGSHLSIKDE